ncbi:FAD-dependent oxidoreductase [Bacillus xiapuensis]|uniref:FAD-dependent oxidoreductase n=1 Tax=Bacillus xiapuensis TaxID=2014075 RepID=UPI000C239E7B|nr:FAD-dependent oxidoreductase [Bacillus xiapuensis]
MSNKSHQPMWKEEGSAPSFPALKETAFADTVIVGGGITGIVSAYLLTKAGKKVVLLESTKLVNGTTGHTTAKVTSQHNLIYDQLIQTIGEQQARLYYEANQEALQWVRRVIQENKIDCDWEDETAFVYTNADKETETVKNEAESYKQLGIAGSLTDTMPWKTPFKEAVSMEGQGQFHPLKFLSPLIQYITENGGEIYESTVAKDIEKGDRQTVITKDGAKAIGDHIVIASHFPFYDDGFYFAKMHAQRSYVIAIKPKTAFPGGMYITAETPTRSVRSARLHGEEVLLIGGEGHKTGKKQGTEENYQALINFAEKEFGIEQLLHSWSAQDLVTLDNIPYIGRLRKDENIYVATGFKKWGMTSSIVSALLLSDLILNKQNRYAELFSPERFTADPSIRNFVKQNSDVAGTFIKGKLDRLFREQEALPPNKGVVINWEGKRAGAFKEEDGTVHIVDTTCTHLGCECEWNEAERTWDCPCHGSRFAVTGEVVEGPAIEPLRKIGRD